MSGQVRVSGMPVHRKDREMPPVNSEITEYKLTFAEAVDMGVNPRKALGYDNPSRNKDVTPERLQACVDAGLTVEEMAQGFGSTVGSLESRAYNVKFKLRDEMKKAAKAAAPVDKMAKVKAEVQEVIAAADDQEEAVQEIEAAVERSTVGNRESEQMFSLGEQEDEFVHEFTGGTTMIQEPRLIIRGNKRIGIAGFALEEVRYTLSLSKSMKKIRLQKSEKGVKVTKTKGTMHYEASCKGLVDLIAKTGAEFPVVFVMNPETLIGEMQ